MMKRPNFVRKSMPSKGVATVANKKSNSKFCPQKQTEKRVGFAMRLPPVAYMWVASWKHAEKWTAIIH
jgi:hypothetical protein